VPPTGGCTEKHEGHPSSTTKGLVPSWINEQVTQGFEDFLPQVGSAYSFKLYGRHMSS
jgi:hypothetical protein